MLTRRVNILADRREGRIVRWPPEQKPPRGTQLNRSHPLARDLIICLTLCEGGGTQVYDAANGLIGDLKAREQSNPTWIGANTGWGLKVVAQSDDCIDLGTPDILNTLGAQTMVTRALITDSMAEEHYFYSKDTDGIELRWRAYGNTGYSHFEVDFDTTDLEVTSNTGFIDSNNYRTYALTWDGSVTASNVHMYRDGIEASSYPTQNNGEGSQVSDAAYSAIVFNRSQTVDRGLGGIFEFFYIYDRALTPAEIQWLAREPYCMFHNERRVSILTPLYRFWPDDVQSLWYSRGNYGTLPSDNTDLENDFTGKDYEDVELDDDAYVGQEGTDENVIFLFKEQHENNTDPITATWTGKTDTSGTVYLQIYDQKRGTWGELDSDSATANVELTLSGSVS